MKKYKYFSIFVIMLMLMVISYNFFSDSFAVGDYSFVSKNKNSISFSRKKMDGSCFLNTDFNCYHEGDSDITNIPSTFVIANGDNNVYAFCGDMDGVAPNQSSHTYSRISFTDFDGERWENVTEEKREKIRNILYAFNGLVGKDEDNLTNFKNYLMTNYPTLYSENDFANLTSDEVKGAVSMAIWYFTNNVRYATKTNTRVNSLYELLIQKENNLIVSTSSDGTYAPTFKVTSNLTWTDDKLVTTIAPNTTFNYETDQYSIVFKTNTGIVLTPEATKLDNNGGYTYSFRNITLNENGRLVYDGVVLESISAVINVESSSIYSNDAYVYVPDSDYYQILVGLEQTSKTNNQSLTLVVPNFEKVNIKFNKVDYDNKGIKLIGAKLKLYYINGTDKELVDEWVSNGSFHEITNLTQGTYVIEETQLPNGYNKVNDYYLEDNDKIYVSADKEFVITDSVNEIDIVDIKNKLKVIKKDMQGNTIPGVKFNIINNRGEVVTNFISSNSAVNLDGELNCGVYFIEEIETPTNYKKSDDLYRFTVCNKNDYLVSGSLPGMVDNIDTLVPGKKYSTRNIVDVEPDNFTISLTNEKGVTISKKDMANTDLYVIGAKLTITKKGTNDVVDEWITTNEDHLTFLDDGEYTLTEKITAGGYSTAESINFKIQNNQVVGGTDLNMKDARLNVCIAKKAVNVEGNLPGAKFELFDSNGRLVGSFTTTNEEYCFNSDTTVEVSNKDIKPGVYRLKEVEPPIGYKYKNQYTMITIKDTLDKQLFEVYNEVEVPKTDMDISTIVYILTIVTGILGMGMIVYFSNKYETKKEI